MTAPTRMTPERVQRLRTRASLSQTRQAVAAARTRKLRRGSRAQWRAQQTGLMVTRRRHRELEEFVAGLIWLGENASRIADAIRRLKPTGDAAANGRIGS